MKSSGSCELRPLDVVNNLVVWMILKILGYVSMVLNAINNSRL